MTKIATHKVFSVPIFEFKLNDHIEINKELEKYIYDLMKKDEQGIKV